MSSTTLGGELGQNTSCPIDPIRCEDHTPYHFEGVVRELMLQWLSVATSAASSSVDTMLSCVLCFWHSFSDRMPASQFTQQTRNASSTGFRSLPFREVTTPTSCKREASPQQNYCGFGKTRRCVNGLSACPGSCRAAACSTESSFKYNPVTYIKTILIDLMNG